MIKYKGQLTIIGMISETITQDDEMIEERRKTSDLWIDIKL